MLITIFDVDNVIKYFDKKLSVASFYEIVLIIDESFCIYLKKVKIKLKRF